MEYFEYQVTAHSIEELEKMGVVVDPESNIVFACRADGSCAMQDVAREHMEKLAGLFNEMGREGWELVQLVFHSSGIVGFWKRRSREGQ
jgi:hypothetical protein